MAGSTGERPFSDILRILLCYMFLVINFMEVSKIKNVNFSY